MNWVISKRHSRLCIANELKDNMTLSCELVKKLVSGGDTISGRMLHKNVIQYVPQTTYYMFLNDWFNKISKVDNELKRRLRFIRPAYNYLDESSREYQQSKDLPHIRKADTTIKDWVVQSKTREYVLHMILKYYKHEQPIEPQCCKDLFDEYIDDTDFSSTIKEYVSVTKDKRDFIKVKNVYSHIKDKVPMCKNLTNKYIKDILVNTMGVIYTNKKYMGEQNWSFIGVKLLTPNEYNNNPTDNNEYDSDADL
jgi:phage/plasmid-associated DNA primase